MSQLVTRVDETLAASIDELVAEGVVESRSEAVRTGLKMLIEQTRRTRIGQQIVDSYTSMPQTKSDVGISDEATARMIAEESW